MSTLRVVWAPRGGGSIRTMHHDTIRSRREVGGTQRAGAHRSSAGIARARSYSEQACSTPDLRRARLGSVRASPGSGFGLEVELRRELLVEGEKGVADDPRIEPSR